jgi:hypothetical protein
VCVCLSVCVCVCVCVFVCVREREREVETEYEECGRLNRITVPSPWTRNKVPSGHLVVLLAVTSYPSVSLYPSNVLDIGTFSPFMNHCGEMDSDSSSYRGYKTSLTLAQG